MKHDRIAQCDAEAPLARALVASARNAGIEARIARHRSRPWASATFVGDQHRLTIVAPDAAAFTEWASSLPDAPLVVRGHLVASLAVDAVERAAGEASLAIAVLTLMES